jgi:uncharacterized damage-inducible protein DinB
LHKDIPVQDDFETLFAYNRWANERVLGACRKLSAEQYAAEPVPGWSSVRSTIVHIAVVADGWLRALTGEVVGDPPAETELPSVDHAQALLANADDTAGKFLANITPERLMTPMTIKGRGRTATLPPWVVLRHVANHSTYHRAQVASKLKRLGIEQPETDFIYFAFEQLQRKS